MTRASSFPVLPTRLATQWFELWLAAPQVMALRMTQVATPVWTTAARRALANEVQLMSSEKLAAAAESAWAVWLQLGQWQMQVALQAWQAAFAAPAALARGQLPTIARTASAAAALNQLTSRALAPVHRRVTANARRLRKRLRD
jgi:hypothetical protein